MNLTVKLRKDDSTRRMVKALRRCGKDALVLMAYNRLPGRELMSFHEDARMKLMRETRRTLVRFVAAKMKANGEVA